ncbi:hypothetical protein F5883DRAFT_126859 [Diaporthe sp. PMI_573]|nr:hypothetical protein F5883DRAFT_126859 [Diaporthaceae sp. PMI_573]
MATKQPSKRLSHLQLAESQPNHVSQQCGASKGTAFCSSAHLEEDNTKVSDSVQRRRIQNKIAQRKYHKATNRNFE